LLEKFRFNCLKDYFIKQIKYKILRQGKYLENIPIKSIGVNIQNNFLLDFFENYGILRALKNMEIDD